MSAGGAIEYPRFNWIEDCIGGIVTLFDKPLEPNPEELGFQYLFVPTPDFRPPPNLPRIVTFIEAQVGQGRGVLVHCFAGIGRTETVA